MRKVRPEDVKSVFQSDVQALSEYLSRTRRAIESESKQKADISRLMSTSFLTLYVYFERFQSDLFLAYLNRDFSQFQRDLASRVEQSVESRFGRFAKIRTRFEPLKHVPVAAPEEIVDASGRNLSFQDAADMKEKARMWLAPGYGARILAMTPHDERLIDTARAIRDFIAHESPAAKAHMNERLATVTDGPNNEYLSTGPNLVHNVGSYLKALFDGRRRIAIYAGRLIAISHSL